MKGKTKPRPILRSSKFTVSTSNVFADLGFAPEEAENLHLRAELMTRLTRLIEKRGLTQSEAAKLLNVAQPRISDLTRGKIHLFSIDTLIAMLGQTGVKVGVTFNPAKVA
jgi:predicted XRE-type DNA-binding protein